MILEWYLLGDLQYSNIEYNDYNYKFDLIQISMKK